MHKSVVNLVKVRLDQKEYSPELPELVIYPGLSHSLTITPDWQELGWKSALAVVTKTLPDGSIHNLEAQLSEETPTACFELGPFTAPPVYEHEAGFVYFRGYRLEIRLKEPTAGRTLFHIAFYQGLSEEPSAYGSDRGQRNDWRQGNEILAKPGRLIAGKKERIVYHPMHGSESAFSLRLADKVLIDQNALEIQCRLNEGAMVAELSCVLRVIAPGGEFVYSEELTLQRGIEWAKFNLYPDDWSVGDYRIQLLPVLQGKVWEEGPGIIYRRREPDSSIVLVSELAPWKLQRDPDRKEIVISDFREASDESKPVSLKLDAKGCYAVFARIVGQGCLVQVTKDGLVRAVKGASVAKETFVCARELDDGIIKIFAFDTLVESGSGLARLRLVPVTPESVKSFYKEASHPPVPLYGVNDWCCYFDENPARLAQDQFDTIVGGQAELGMRTLDWSVGRSWVEYHSDLPGTTRFPCTPIEEAIKTFPGAQNYHRTTMINQYRPLSSVYENRQRFGTRIWPWLAMQRHYGVNSYGGIFASRFFREHQELRRWRKNAQGPDSGEVCYFFPEVRQERVDILLETAAKGADGLLVGCCRQVPMLLYHPEMVKTYREKTGVNPLKIDASHKEAYKDWIKWRADFFTQVLRDLKKGLAPIEKEMGKHIPVAVRVPSAGLFYNLAQGLDVEQWLIEGLVDQLHLDPLEDRDGRGSHDVCPYCELGRRYGVPIIGGVGSTWSMNPEAYVTGLKRALGLLRSGVDGIEIYETEMLAESTSYRWGLPLFGDIARIEDFLKNSNIEACYPVRASSAAYGHDNHSVWGGTWRNWSVYGQGGQAL